MLFNFFIWESLPLCKLKKIVFLHLKMLYTWIIYTSVRVLLRRIYTFCVIWLKQCFLHLKMSSIRKIYTPLCEYFSISFLEEYLPNGNGIYTWKCYLPEEYTPLCECFFNFFIEEYPLLCELTKIIFSTLKNCLQHEIYIPLSECFSIFQWRIFTSVRVD